MGWTEEIDALAALSKDKIVLELGSAQGSSTCRLAETAKEVHSVDWHYGDPHNGETDTLPHYLEQTRRRANIITHLGRFEDVCPSLRAMYFDVIFIDGYHTYDAVKRDITLVERLLKDGGIMAFHDYDDNGIFGVIQAVNERYKVTKLVETLAIVEYVDASP